MDRILEKLGWMTLFLMVFSLLLGYGFLKIDQKKEQILMMEYEEEPEQYRTEYFGYLSFPNYQQYRFIMYGSPEQAVKQFKIGIFGEEPKNVPSDPLILVGHSRKNQFEILHKLKIGDVVELTKEKNRYQYHVVRKEVIEESDITFMKKVHNHMLVLITCMNDNEKRLVVYCQI